MGGCVSRPTPPPAKLVGRWRGVAPDGSRKVELTVASTGKVSFKEVTRTSTSSSTAKEFSGLPCTGWEPRADLDGVSEIFGRVACITAKRKIRLGHQDREWSGQQFEWCHGKTWITMKRVGGAVPMQPVVLSAGGGASVEVQPAAAAAAAAARGCPPPGRRKYKKDEVYLDVVEALHYRVSQPESGAEASASQLAVVTEHEVRGRVALRVRLNAPSECRLGLHDRLTAEAAEHASTGGRGIGRGKGVSPAMAKGRKATAELVDVELHECVDRAKFEADRSIVFAPPDGEFDLLRYTSPGERAPSSCPTDLILPSCPADLLLPSCPAALLVPMAQAACVCPRGPPSGPARTGPALARATERRLRRRATAAQATRVPPSPL